jgi:hypothetical protein
VCAPDPEMKPDAALRSVRLEVQLGSEIEVHAVAAHDRANDSAEVFSASVLGSRCNGLHVAASGAPKPLPIRTVAVTDETIRERLPDAEGPHVPARHGGSGVTGEVTVRHDVAVATGRNPAQGGVAVGLLVVASRGSGGGRRRTQQRERRMPTLATLHIRCPLCGRIELFTSSECSILLHARELLVRKCPGRSPVTDGACESVARNITVHPSDPDERCGAYRVLQPTNEVRHHGIGGSALAPNADSPAEPRPR